MRTVVAFGTMPALDVFDGPDIDVVVTDVKLPAGESDGSALARMIRNRRPQVPIILMSAHPRFSMSPRLQAFGDRRTLPCDQGTPNAIARRVSWT
jgi:CheY-like chemotaxis protein